MAYVVQLKDFEGPLDLLLHLIGRAKVRIEDIFVSEITEQYLASVQDVSGLDMDTASEFLQMAATLMEIKSRALLPKQKASEEEEDPKEVLLRRLEEYRRIKEAGKALRLHEEEAAETVSRLPMEMVTETKVELGALSLRALQEAFLNVLRRAERSQLAESPARRIQRERFTIGDCMLRILKRVLLYGNVQFYDLFPVDATRQEIVTTFLAMLELVKANRIALEQEGIYGPIVIREGKGEAGDAGYAGGEGLGA
jgi:segregation and condensation protein A